MEVSSLSDAEYVQLIANYNNAGQDDEEQILRDRGYSEGEIKVALKDKKPNSFKSLNVVFNDKTSFKYVRFSMVFSAYMAFKRGVLPHSGSFMDQPSKIIDIFNIIQQLELEAEQAAQKAANKKAKRG